MELRNQTTGAVITDSQFRSEHPNTSFPKVLTPDILDGFGYDPILEGPQATVTPPYEYSQRAGIEEVNGQWFTKYIVGPVFEDYTDEEGVLHTAAEQESEYKARKDEEQAKSVRADRNRRLADCDWTQLSNCPLSDADKAAWATYRGELRDLPQQSGFPWNVTWPEQPS